MGGLCQERRKEGYFSKFSNQFLYQQEHFQLLLHSDFSPSKLFCEEGSQVTHACITEHCKVNAFKCDKANCKKCSQLHLSCNLEKIKTMESEYENRVRRHENFLKKIFEDQRKAFVQIQENRNKLIQEFKKQEYDSYSFDIIKKMFVTKQKVEIEGELIGQLYKDLKSVNEKSQKKAIQLSSFFEQELLRIVDNFKAHQKEVLSQFALNERLFFEYAGNPHKNKFEVVYLDNRAKLKLKNDDRFWYNFVLDKKIQDNAKTSFKIRQTKTKEKNVLIGICTSAIFGKTNAYKHQEVAVYITGDGFICESGNDRKGGKPLKDGQAVTVFVDKVNNKVSWVVGTEQLCKIDIPKSMLKKELFLVIMMYTQNDQLEIYF